MIQLMDARYQMLVATVDAWTRTGVLLVQSSSGGFAPAGFSDDPGLYLIVPWLARTFGLSVTQSVDTFFVVLITVAALLGAIGNWRYASTWFGRIFGTTIILGLSIVAFRIGDVYVVSFALPVAFVPWVLCLTRNRTLPGSLMLLMPVLGSCIVISHYIRNQSGTAMLIFTVVLVCYYVRAPVRRKGAAVALLVVGVLLIALPFAGATRNRDDFLVGQDSSYEPGAIRHPLWHSAYLGLGYIPNQYVAGYSDEFAAARVKELAPDAEYLSKEYEDTLRGEVFRIARQDPWFIFRELAAKSAAVAFKILVFLNLALVALLFARPPRLVIIAFTGAIAFQTLPALLAIPDRAYMLGLYAFTSLFAIVCVDVAWPRIHDRMSALWPQESSVK